MKLKINEEQLRMVKLMSLGNWRTGLESIKTVQNFNILRQSILCRWYSVTDARWIWAAGRLWRGLHFSTFRASTVAQICGVTAQPGAVVAALRNRQTAKSWTLATANIRLAACRPTLRICPASFRVSSGALYCRTRNGVLNWTSVFCLTELLNSFRIYDFVS